MTTALSHPTRSSTAAAGGGRIRVLVVDDHPAVRHGVAGLIEQQPDMTVIAIASNADDAPALDGSVDVAVLDYHLGARDGLWLTRRLKQLARPPRVLIYSAFADHTLAAAARIAGADGLLGKCALAEELPIVIRRLAAGRLNLPAVAAPVARALRSRLAARDQALFGMLLHGVDPAEVAATLAISDAELELRRAAILSTLSPPEETGRQAPPTGPLDYERPRRRRGCAAA
ncbi:MAG TPA: response regulator transcription factor [Solirubrobacteraceae bacterium]|nr:response regulator transcription factor [Solirubrobacteraceae bacterium]